MKIGILTYHAACNFGANLQALSTVEYFRNHGYEVEVINYLPEELEHFYEVKVPQIQYKEHQRFRECFLPMSKRCYNDEDVARVIEEDEIQAVVIGSDAVIQHHPLRSRIFFSKRRFLYVYHPTKDRMCPNPFWGSFIPMLSRSIPVCYMSASSQNSAYQMSTKKEKKLMNEHLSRFSYISTRDDWTANMVTFITDGKVVPKITPDPVFAFNHNVKNQPTAEYIKEKFGLADKYILLSFLNSNTVSLDWLNKFKSIAENNDVQCVALPFPNGVKYSHNFGKEISLPLSPIDWYALIRYSQGYVGHNMHPIVVSLHNGVPCFSFDQYGIVKYLFFPKEKSSKIYHIMNLFGVSDNRMSDIGVFKKVPSPEYVYNHLMYYDRKHVAGFADQYLRQYISMMESIERIIKQQ